MREAPSGVYTGENPASVNQSILSLAIVSNQESSPCLSLLPIPLKWIVFRLRELNSVQVVFAYSGLLMQARLKGVLMAQGLEWG